MEIQIISIRFPIMVTINRPGLADLPTKSWNYCFCCSCFLVIGPKAQLLKKNAWLLYQIGDKAPPAARDSIEVAGCYYHNGNGGLSWCLSSSLLCR